LPRIGLSLLGRRQQRHLSLDLGDGVCKWVPAETPETDGVIDFHKTLIAGYPSGDKRMVYIQMEALTGWAAIDSWDFYAKANNPFIKTNYPHLAGTWGWNNEADQVVLVLRNMRTSLIEYHDVVWDFDYETVMDPEFLNRTELGALRNSKLYASQPPLEAFYTWRDARIMDEIHWYGWFIDYWMEGGLQRDVLTHQITTEEHWNELRESHGHALRDQEALSYNDFVGPDTVVTPSYDAFCDTDSSAISGGCAPVAIFSGEKLMDYDTGPAETTAIANTLLRDDRMRAYVITDEAWDCIWNETIVNKKGGTTAYDRPGHNAADGRDYSDRKFSAEMLEEMSLELTRLISKYSEDEWNTQATANRLVELLTEHRASIDAEFDEVNLGLRLLKAEDFLGPKERIRQRIKKLQQLTGTMPEESPEVQAAFVRRFDAEEKRVLMEWQRGERRTSFMAGSKW